MATAQINGIDIRYEDSGGDRPALLFSHGFLMDHTMFDPQIDHLAGDYRCIRWDERGFGDTLTRGPFTYWDSADDALGLLDHLGVERAVFVGMSQGGFLSLRAALAHPDRVAALVLIDSAADTDDDEALAGNQAMMHVLTTGSDEAREAVFQIVAGRILADDRLAEHWIPRWRAIERDQLAAAGEALLGREDISDRIPEIRCPIVAVHGSDDEGIAIDRAHALAAAAGDHRGVVTIDGAAHAPNLTHPARVNAAIADFLASL